MLLLRLVFHFYCILNTASHFLHFIINVLCQRATNFTLGDIMSLKISSINNTAVNCNYSLWYFSCSSRWLQPWNRASIWELIAWAFARQCIINIRRTVTFNTSAFISSADLWHSLYCLICLSASSGIFCLSSICMK